MWETNSLSKIVKAFKDSRYLYLDRMPENRQIVHHISYHLRQLYSVLPFHSVPPFRNCCTLLALPISPEIMDGFWCSRCLNDRVNLLYMIGSIASGTTNTLVAKIGTKNLTTSCWVYIIWTNGLILMLKVSKWPYQSAQCYWIIIGSL